MPSSFVLELLHRRPGLAPHEHVLLLVEAVLRNRQGEDGLIEAKVQRLGRLPDEPLPQGWVELSWSHRFRNEVADGPAKVSKISWDGKQIVLHEGPELSDVEVLADLLHELGHFLQGPPESTGVDLERELDAWDRGWGWLERTSPDDCARLCEHYARRRDACLGTTRLTLAEHNRRLAARAARAS